MALAEILARVAGRRENLWRQNPGLKDQVEDMLAGQEKNLPAWLEQAKQNLAAKGCRILTANTSDEALEQILALAGKGPVVQAYSPLLQSLGWPGRLRQAGVTITETNFAALAVDLLNRTTAHSDFPAGDLSGLDIIQALAIYAGMDGETDKEKILRAVRRRLREEAEKAPLGISGVSAVIAEHGSIVLAEDQGHLRAVSNLPPVHVAVVSPRQIVPTLDDAVRFLRYQAIERYGKDIQTYLSVISGPSRTADIEFKMVNGVHGPGELYVLFLQT